MKIEYLSIDPPLVQVHDFVRDGMIVSIKYRAKDELYRSDVLSFQNDPNHGEVRNEMSRTSVSTWISQHEFPELKPLYKKIEYLMGLNVLGMNDSEPLHVVVYSSLGSHYVPHTDLVSCVIQLNWFLARHT